MEDFFQAFFGRNFDNIASLFNVNITDVIENPNIISQRLESLLSGINYSALDYTQPSSEINIIGLGTAMKGLLNLEEIMTSTFSQVFGFSSRQQSNNERENLKTAIEMKFIYFILLDIFNQFGTTMIDSMEDPSAKSSVVMGIDLGKLFISGLLAGLGTNLWLDINSLQNSNIIGSNSILKGEENIIVAIFNLLTDYCHYKSIKWNFLTGTFRFLSGFWSILYNIAKAKNSLDDIINNVTTFGFVYNSITFIECGLNIMRALNGISTSLSDFDKWTDITKWLLLLILFKK